MLEDHDPIWTVVCGGYSDAAEVVSVMQAEGVEGHVDALHERAEALLRERVRELGGKHPQYERLRAVFDHLEDTDVLVRENYWCCQTCAHDAIGRELREHADNDEPARAYLLFHMQDTERAVEAGLLILRFCAAPEEEGETVATASKRFAGEVVTLLREAGFDTRWSGNPEETIELSIVWDKAPPPARQLH